MELIQVSTLQNDQTHVCLNCLSAFDHFVELLLKRLKLSSRIQAYLPFHQTYLMELYCENS